MAMCLAQQPEADALLDENPLALLLGMLLDMNLEEQKTLRTGL